MPLSRRQFFQRFWSAEERSANRRRLRILAIENDARRYLLPYDFALLPEQEAELFADIREMLSTIPETELFGPTILQQVEQLVQVKLEPWRAESLRLDEAHRIAEIRRAAPQYVAAFMSLHATPEVTSQLSRRFEVAEPEMLNRRLELEIESWITTLDDQQLQDYNVLSIEDLVFAQLRSWC